MDGRTGVQAALFCTEHALLCCHADHETRMHSRTDCKSASAAAVHTVRGYKFVRRHGLRSGGKRCGKVDSISFRAKLRARIYISTAILSLEYNYNISDVITHTERAQKMSSSL